MIPDIYKDLLQKLVSKTREGKANWKTTSQENTFLLSFGDFSVAIFKGTDFHENETVFINLYNKQGKIIDEFHVSDGAEEFIELDDLFDTARRKARRIDMAIEAISAALDADTEVGETGNAPADTDDDMPF